MSMGCKLRLLFSAYFFLVFTQFGLLVASGPQVPCYFIFGDSLVDNGNNNGLETIVKANYPPYGIDFPLGTTGRFTNGRTMVDIIGELLGLEEFIPPFATATDHEIHRGVNYGSAGAGIRDETGRQLGGRISLNMQLLNHNATVSRLSSLQKDVTCTQEHLRKCIYTVGMGSNDYVNNYLQPNIYNTSSQYTPDQYAEVLIQQYSQQLTTLFNLGARKIGVFGLGQLGCSPGAIAAFGTNGEPCVENINDMLQLFNDRLKPLVDELNNNLIGAKFTFINITSISTPNPSQAGPRVANKPCCQVRADGQCAANTSPCLTRDLYAFYDNFHPSEITNLVVATRSYNALSPSDASPVDIGHLARL